MARLTDYHARAVEALGVQADLVGFHGQTILHQPDRRRTWQVGDAAFAGRLGMPVVHDFRSADVAAGGQGAPFAPVYHAALAAGWRRPLAVLNIGGVANVTWIGPDGALLAFDTGPGNGPLDDWVFRHTGQGFDADGALAAPGWWTGGAWAADGASVFRAAGAEVARSAGFQPVLAASGLAGLSAADGAATLAAFTVASVAASVLPEPPRRWLVTGGGRLNPVLMEGLRDALGVRSSRSRPSAGMATRWRRSALGFWPPGWWRVCR